VQEKKGKKLFVENYSKTKKILGRVYLESSRSLKFFFLNQEKSIEIPEALGIEVWVQSFIFEKKIKKKKR